MKERKENKLNRILSIYTRLLNGEIINKAAEAERYNVNARSIQRDIDNIRNFFYEEGAREGVVNNVLYDRDKNGFRLEHRY